MVPLASAEELGEFTARPIPAGRAELLLDLASASVRAHCGWHIAPSVTETLVLDAVPERVLLLPSTYVTAVAAVRVDGAALAVDGYQWSQSGRVWRPGGWGWDYRSVEVDLTHGYAVVPAVVRSVVLSVAARQAVNPEGLKALTVGGIARTYANGSAADAGVGLSTLETDALTAYVVRGRA